MARVSLIAANNINVERHAYCLCLHVRPATIFVAVINLVILIIIIRFNVCINNLFFLLTIGWFIDLCPVDILFYGKQ